MHHMVTTEYPAKLLSWQGMQYRDRIRRAVQEAGAFRRASIGRLQDQCSPTIPQPLTRLIEPRNCLSSTARQAKQLADTPVQRRFEHGR